MSELDFKKNQLEKVNEAIEVLGGIVDIPNDLIRLKLSLENDISFIQYSYERSKKKVFDSILIIE